MRKSKRAVIISQLLIFIGLFIFWELLVKFEIVSALALAPPSEVFPMIVKRYDLYLEHLWVTVQEIIIGFICGVSLAVVLATIIAHSDFLSRILYPYIIALNSTAKVAIAPLILLIFGHGIRPVVFIVILICFLPLMNNMTIGLKSVEPDLLDLFKIYRANKLQVFLKARLPASLPYFFSGLRTSAIFSVKGAVIGEVFQSADRGLGFLITQGDLFFDVSMIYGGSLIACTIGILFFVAITLLERRVIRWHKSRAGMQE